MNIFPRGRRFTGNSCPKGVYIYEVGVGLGWGENVLWTCTHGRCYASHGMGWGWGGVGMITFFELAHMVGATQVMGLGWGGDDNVLWTCTHGRCYASHGMGWGWGGVGMVTFLALAHMVGATQVMGWVGVGWCGDGNVPWTCTHGRCYATSCSLHLHTWSVLRKSWDWGGVGWGW